MKLIPRFLVSSRPRARRFGFLSSKFQHFRFSAFQYFSLLLPAPAVVTIDYVNIGNAGNAADPLTGYGSVSYDYQIGKYEVTNAQYAEFLNSADPAGSNPNGVYNNSMGSDLRGGISFNAGAANGSKYSVKSNMGNKPVNYVSWYDAARFTNWLHNGQGIGNTEVGAYTLNGNTGAPTKNVGATIWIPTENEWYKAAYHDPTPGAGGGDSYWLYPTQSDTAPTVASANALGDVSNPGENVMNYSNGADWNGLDGNVTTVGSTGSDNFYGTFDQGGNVLEWGDLVSAISIKKRGGWYGYTVGASTWVGSDPLFGEYQDSGFRLASVPEPSAAALALLSAAALLRRRRNLGQPV